MATSVADRAKALHFSLPPLPYSEDALAPVISAETLQLHHGKHHAAYVKNANAALERLDEALGKGDFQSVAHLERTLAFNVSGHLLHSIFWQSMGPGGSPEPGGDLQRVIEKDLGSFDRFRRQMNEVAASIMGSGWAALVWEPASARLLVAQIYDHQSNVVQGGIPIMVIDAWEHAYYLQYENRKAEFFDRLWNVWNWSDIAGRFDAVRRTEVGLTGAADAA